MKSLRSTPILWALTGLLAACGSQTGTTPAGANQTPEVSLKLADGTALSTVPYFNASEALKISASDIDGTITKIHWVIDAGRTTERSSDYTGTDVKGSLDFTLPNLASGTHTITITATDNAGGTGTATGSFKVDAEAPTLTGVTVNSKAVTEGQALTFTVGDAVTLSTTATDTRGGGDTSASGTTTLVYVGSTLAARVPTGTAVDLAAVLGSSTSVSTVRVLTVDSALNTSASRTFTVQFTAATGGGTGTGTTAEPVLSWLAPTGDYVSGNGVVNLRASAFKAAQDLSAQVTYTATCGVVAGSSWTLGNTCADGSKQTITANLVDNGKNYTISKTVTVDASDPTVQITKPQQGQTFTQNPITVSVTGSDAVSGIDRILVEASKDGTTFTSVGVVTAASGDVVWAPMNGTYTLRATATDKTGRSTTTTLSGIKVSLTSSDTTPPTVALTPVPATPQRATITVTARASDTDSGVAKVDLYDGGTLIDTKASGVGGTYTFSLDTTKLTDGTHTLRAVAYDNAGSSSESSTTLTVDNTAPVVNWISPADGSTTGGSVTLNAVTSEGTVTYTVDGAPITGNKATFAGDGTHTITATAQDAAGNRTVNTIRVTSDATAPTAQITSPTSGSTLTSNPVTVAVTGTDTGSGVVSLEVFAGTTSIGSVSGTSGNVTWTPTSGSYALTVIATDKAGNRSTAGTPVNVTVKLATSDTTAPVFSGAPTLQPAPTATFSRGVITVDGFVKDPESGISQVTLYNGGLKLPATPTLSVQPDGSTRYALTLDSTTLADGNYTFTVQATNGVGLISNQPVTVTIDNTAPSLNWNTPTNVGASGTLTLNATSDTGTIAYSASCGTISGTTWNYSACADGAAATLTATATDAAGNTTTQTRTILVDLTAPTVQITGPQDGQKFTQNPITINVTGTDNVAVDHIDVFDGATKIGTVSGAQGSVTWAGPNGTHTLTAKGYDKAGNMATSATVTVTVALTTTDTTPPTGSVTTLPAFIKGQANVTVTASDTDSGVATVQLYTDGVLSGTQANAATGTYTFPVDTTKLTDGNHSFTAVITDNAGNRFSTPAVTSTVNNTAPVVTISSPANGALLGTSSTLTVSASGTDATPGDTVTLEYSVDGGAFSTTAPSVPTVDGTHTVTVRGTDKAGNTSTASSTVTYDGTAPTVQITGPQDGQKFTQNPITINVTGTDNVAVDHIDVFDGATKIGTVSGAQGSVTWAGPNGTHTLTAKGYDKAGNMATSATVTVTVAVPPASSTITAAAPVAAAASTYGTNPLYIVGLGTVSGSASSTAAITSAQLLIDGQISGTATNSTGTASFNFDFGTLNEGLHDLVLRWKDTASTVTDSDKLSIYVDKSAPTIVWNRPTAGSVVNGLVTLDTTVTDSGVGFDPVAVQYFLDGNTTPLTDADPQAGFQFSTNGIVPGSHTITEVVVDRLNNRAQQSITVNTVTKPTVEIANAVALEGAPLSGYVSVNVNAKDQSGIKQVDLFANDVKVASLTSAPYNFALNTANYTNGPVKIFARAINNATPSQTEDSTLVTLTAFNRVAPVLAISSPASGSTVTSPSLPVQISINKKNSAFTVNGGTVTLDLLDYRGQKVDSKTVAVANDTDGVYTSAPFDLAKLPADTYTIRASMTVVLDGITTTTVEATSQITTNTTSVNPPASVVRIPITLANGTNATVVSGSGFLVNVSDDTGVQYVQVRFVNKDGTPLNNSYLLNQGFDVPQKLADVVIPNLDIDGSQYVPDGQYNIRVTVADTTGNRNVQEVPVTVNRSAATNTYLQSVATTPLTPKTATGALTYDNATWTLTEVINGTPTGLKNASRVAAVLYKDGKVIGTRVEAGVTGNQSLNYTFGDIGSYEVDWIVEDLTTGVVKYVTGTAVGVSRNP